MPPASDDPVTQRRLKELEDADNRRDQTMLELDRRTTRLEINYENFKEKTAEFITRQEFTPVRMIVYGLATTALTGLLAAILSRLFAGK